MHQQALIKEDISKRHSKRHRLSILKKEGKFLDLSPVPTAPSHSHGPGLTFRPGQYFQLSICLI